MLNQAVCGLLTGDLHRHSAQTTAGGPRRSALASINEVNLRRARLVLRWATGSIPDSIYFGM